jgi:hypothetical protein
MSLTYTFQSSDTGAPTMNNAAGQFIAVLDACLVNGYNARTVTITRSGTTATINFTAHGWRDGQILVVSGANESDYNIEARCTYIDANNVSIQVANSPATPATGTITCKVAPVGWTKAYSGTNLAAYRMKSGTLQFYLRVDDSGSGDARVVGYEAMTAISTGTGLFPTAVQVSGGLYVYKSGDSTNRPWRMWSDGKLFHWINITNQSTTWVLGNGSGISFGEFISYKPGDAYNCCLQASGSAGNIGSGSYFNGSCSVGSSLTGFYVARSATQTGAAYQAPKPCLAILNVGSYIGSNSYTCNYPDPVHGGANLGPVYVGNEPVTGSYGVRGILQGIWGWGHADGYTFGDTFSGQTGSAIAGRKFEMATNYANARICMETSDTWGGV